MSNKETALVLRVTACDGTSYGGFKWPLEAGVEVVAPDWKATDKCGNGLHGWLYGNGDHSVRSIREDLQWMVVEVVLSDVVMLGGKVKFPRCVIRYVGDRKSATDYLIANEPRANGVIGASVTVGDDQCAQVGALGTATAGHRGTATAGDGGTTTAGDGGTATAGDGGTATAGHRGTATAGHRGTATAGDGGTATAGHRGTATAGDRGTATAGDGGTATAGDGGTATAGYRGTATAGDGGTATAGYRGTATAGDGGTATAGDGGTATAGDGGEIRIRYYDSKHDRMRTRVGYIGEDGLKANTPYRLNDKNEFEEVK